MSAKDKKSEVLSN